MPLLKLQSCKHEIIMKDLCAMCGADLRQLSTQNLQEVVATRSFSMVHVVPELKCSLEQAEKLDQADEVRLLNSRKLILLVDLDQTLIHTTNENIPADLKDVYHFQLYGPHSPWYHTRLRPHTRDFLQKISKYYEMHIFTFGARPYAHHIASILDPDRKIFSHRILSRDESFDATSKTGNLKSLFPRGDSMVSIIDDREDVWNFAPNVVHVKPYLFFNSTGDINSPFLYSLQKNGGTADSCDVISKPEPNSSECNKANSECTDNDKEESPGHASDVPEDGASSDSTPVLESGELVADDSSMNSDDLMPKTQIYDDEDDYLLYLEEILIRIHGAYYDLYDETISQEGASVSRMPDLKNVIPYVRRKVLRNVNLVFSGVIPTNIAPEKSAIWSLAESLGAKVFEDLHFQDRRLRTTHVVASKAGTEKLRQAKKARDIYIVTPSWLMCCATRWERVEERLFPLKKGSIASPLPASLLRSNPPKETLKPHKEKNKGKNKKNKRDIYIPKKVEPQDVNYHPRVPVLEPLLDFTSEELNNMGQEVSDACTSTDDSCDKTCQKKKCGVKRKRSQDTPNSESGEGTQNGRVQSFSLKDGALAQNDVINGDSVSHHSSSSCENSNDSVSSGAEELLAEMERELFGNQSSS